jgi:hypothetical protein
MSIYTVKYILQKTKQDKCLYEKKIGLVILFENDYQKETLV